MEVMSNNKPIFYDMSKSFLLESQNFVTNSIQFRYKLYDVRN
jgi:hypothetical protein